MSTQVIFQIIGIALSISLIIYPRIEQYKDRRKKGFWKKLKPQGKKIFILGLLLTLVQFALLYITTKKTDTFKGKITVLNSKIDSLNKIHGIDILSNSPDLIVHKLVLLEDSISIKVENFGGRSADSVKFKFCAYKLNSRNRIIDELCTKGNKYELPESFKIVKLKASTITIPLGISNYRKKYKGSPFMFKIELDYKDKPTSRNLFYERLYIWEGYEKSKNIVNPASKFYHDLLDEYKRTTTNKG